MGEPLRFFGSIGEDALAFIAERQIHGSRNLLADGGVALDLLSDRFHGGVRTQKTVGQCLVFPQQTEQQVLRFDIRRAKLAGLVTRKEDYAPRFFRVPFEHVPSTWESQCGLNCPSPDLPPSTRTLRLLQAVVIQVKPSSGPNAPQTLLCRQSSRLNF